MHPPILKLQFTREDPGLAAPPPAFVACCRRMRLAITHPRAEDLLGYKYHVFLSYKRARDKNGTPRDDAVETWVKMFFEGELQNRLTDALGEPAEVFFDQADIRSGEEWKLSIAEALRRSVCIVPVWSAPYFDSKWCRSEWASFRRAGRPVVPVRWSSRMDLPAGAGATQGRDFSKLNYTTRSFRDSEKYLVFQDEVKAFARDVAAAVRRAPDFDEGVPIVLPEPPCDPTPPHVLLFHELHDKDQFLVVRRSRLSRNDLSLKPAAA